MLGLFFALILMNHTATASFSKYHVAILCVVGLTLVFCSWSQPANQSRKKQPYTWIFSTGYVVVNDNEEKLPNLFDTQNSWNYSVFPSYFSFNKFSKKGFSNEGFFSYNPYRSDAIVNGRSNVEGFLATANYAYKCNINPFIKIIPQDIDPFVAVGAGLTYRYADSGALCATANLHLGINFWLSKHWGLQAQGIGKLALLQDIYTSNQDYIQFTVGLCYRTLPKKRYNRDKRRYGWTREKNRYKRGDSR
jgi:hypothetical protein